MKQGALEGLKGVSEHEIVHPMCMTYFQRETRERKICCKKGNEGPSTKIQDLPSMWQRKNTLLSPLFFKKIIIESTVQHVNLLTLDCLINYFKYVVLC